LEHGYGKPAVHTSDRALPKDETHLSWGAGRGARHLVVLCHGIAATPQQAAPVAAAWSRALPDTIFLAPAAPFPHVGRRGRFLPFGLGVHGREWYSIIDSSPEGQERGIRRAAEALDGFIDDALDRLALPRDAYALAGFSQGGMTALFAGLRRRVAPRAILTFAGSLIAPSRLPGEIRNRPPVLLVHGEADPIVPAEASRSAARHLTALGVPVRSLFRPHLGHNIDEPGIAAGAELLRSSLG
jgi:phospholipase/carboxylesterase